MFSNLNLDKWNTFSSGKDFTIFSLPQDKNLMLVQLKTFADDKINGTQKFKFVLGWERNIVGKGENASIFFFFFLRCFQKASSTGR